VKGPRAIRRSGGPEGGRVLAVRVVGILAPPTVRRRVGVRSDLFLAEGEEEVVRHVAGRGGLGRHELVPDRVERLPRGRRSLEAFVGGLELPVGAGGRSEGDLLLDLEPPELAHRRLEAGVALRGDLAADLLAFPPELQREGDRTPVPRGGVRDPGRTLDQAFGHVLEVGGRVLSEHLSVADTERKQDRDRDENGFHGPLLTVAITRLVEMFRCDAYRTTIGLTGRNIYYADISSFVKTSGSRFYLLEAEI